MTNKETINIFKNVSKVFRENTGKDILLTSSYLDERGPYDVKGGMIFSEDLYNLSIELNHKKTASITTIFFSIIHEFYHCIQLEWYGHNKFSRIIDKNLVILVKSSHEYRIAQIELEANAFAYFICNYFPSSYKEKTRKVIRKESKNHIYSICEKQYFRGI